MTRSTPHSLRPASPARPVDELAAPTDDESSRVVARPDGFYWLADDGAQQFGPFDTAMQALAALREGIDTELEPEPLQQAEAEIGYVGPPLDDEGMPEER